MTDINKTFLDLSVIRILVQDIGEPDLQTFSYIFERIRYLAQKVEFSPEDQQLLHSKTQQSFPSKVRKITFFLTPFFI